MDGANAYGWELVIMLIQSSLLSSQRNIEKSNSLLAKSFEKLSTGKKVNSAMDDATAISIINQMESELSSLNGSLSNDQFNKAMYQVADGALSQVGSMMSEMKALAVRAGNSTLSASDRSALTSQMNELTSQINMVQSQTTFNTKAVFNQNFQVMADKTKPSGNAGGNAAVQETPPTTGTQPAQGYEVEINYQSAGPNSVKILQNPYNAKTGTLSVSALTGGIEMISGKERNINNVIAPQNGSININGTNISINSGDSIDNIISKINSVNSQTGVVATKDTFHDTYHLRLTAGLLGTEYAAESGNPNSPGKLIYGEEGNFSVGGDSQLLDNLGLTSNLRTSSAPHGSTAILDHQLGGETFAIAPATKNGEFIYEITDKNSNFYGLKFSFNFGKADERSDMNKFRFASGFQGEFDITFKKSEAVPGTGTTDTAASGNNGVRNSNAGNSQGNAPTIIESLQSINLSSPSSASSALNTIDQAINDINRVRAGIGANINRIDSNTAVTMIKRENTTAALSKIQDTDMAQEVSNMTKTMIQYQASIAAQSHSLKNQNAMSLLAGI